MPSIRICRRSLRRSTDSGKQEEKSVNEQDMKVFGGSEGFHVLFLLPGNRKELSTADSVGVGSTFCFCMKLFRNLEIMVANFQQIVYNEFTNKRFFIQNI